MMSWKQPNAMKAQAEAEQLKKVTQTLHACIRDNYILLLHSENNLNEEWSACTVVTTGKPHVPQQQGSLRSYNKGMKSLNGMILGDIALMYH